MQSSENFVNGGFKKFEKCEEDLTWAADAFGRKDIAEQLTRLIANTDDPCVIGLVSPWGSGKTFFLRAWGNDLQSQNRACVYFNAWEADCSGDPLVALMSCIHDSLKTKQWTLPNLFENINKLIEIVPELIRPLTSALSVADPQAKSLELAGKAAIATVQRHRANTKLFPKTLKNIAKSVRDQCEDFPLLIMIDEMDRCRPDYAIALLERIKHLFSVAGVIFIIAIDPRQLLMLVEHTFGLKYDQHAENGKAINHDTRLDYLGKFFDIYYNLPEPDISILIEKYLLELPAIAAAYQAVKDGQDRIFANLKISPEKILTGDKSIFAGKSLRIILQDLGRFSVLLRAYPTLSFYEVFLSFLIIMLHDNRLSCDYSCDKIRMATEDAIALMKEKHSKTIYNDINEELWRKSREAWEEFNVKPYADVEYCVNMCIRMCMTNKGSVRHEEMASCFMGVMQSKSFYEIGISGQRTIYTYYFQMPSMNEVFMSIQQKLNFIQQFNT